jgi:hypothetical protein
MALEYCLIDVGICKTYFRGSLKDLNLTGDILLCLEMASGIRPDRRQTSIHDYCRPLYLFQVQGQFNFKQAIVINGH